MRLISRLAYALLLVLTLIVGVTAAAVIIAETAWFKNWLRVYIVREAHQYLNGTVSIDRLGGNLFYGIELENIAVSMDGSQVVAIKDLGLNYSAFELLTRGLSVDNVRLNQPVIYLRREGDTWSLSRLIKKEEQEADRRGPAKPITIADIGISDGSIVMTDAVGTSGVSVPKRVDHLDAKLAFKYEPVRYSIEITHVSFRGSDPAIALNALSGGVAVREDTLFVDKLAVRTAETSMSIDGAVQQYLSKPVFNLQITSDKLSVPEIAQLVPSLAGIRLQPAFELRLSGPLDRLGADVNVRSSAGNLVGQFVLDVQEPQQAAEGTVSIRHLDLAPIVANPQQRSDITADAKFDVRGASLDDFASLRGTATIDAPRIVAAGYTTERMHVDANIDGRRIRVNGHTNAYGAAATASGTVTLPPSASKKPLPVAFDLHGQARHVNVAKLPRTAKLPPAATDVNAAYHVVGSTASGSGLGPVRADLRFNPSTVAGAAIAEGSTASVTTNGDVMGYSADLTVNGLDLQRFGRDFRVPALAVDRYQSTLNGHVMVSGRGTTPETANLTANGTLHDTSILGGRLPQLSFDAGVADNAAHVKATGEFADVDPAVATGKAQAKGAVNGTLDVDATVTHLSDGVHPETVDASGTVMLGRSTVGELQIDRANIDADYHDSTGTIRSAEVVGRDVNVKATGTLALNDTGHSNLTVHADSPSLEEIGKLIDQPLTGIGKLDAVVTGNKRELQATGTFVGDGIKRGENGALTLSGDYTAKIPELSLEDATISATTRGSFVTIAGQNINEVTAKTTYHQKQLEFDFDAKQPERSLGAGGSLVIHPDHQEVHLASLALQTAGQSWQLAPGAKPTVQYGGDAIGVEQLKLTSGAQEIEANGRFGRAGDKLDVTLNNVDLASVDALLLRPPQFSGRLNGAAVVTGTKDAPQVKADFKVNQGGFRQFRYDTFGGTVSYGGKGVTLDARLDQNPTTWAEAKGYVPLAAFKSSETTLPHSHTEAASPEDRFDLHVKSSPIDLGIVQGFTTALTNVKGTVQATVDVTGAANDPHPEGEVSVQNAAFTVGPTGVSYTNVGGKVELQGDKVHIDDLELYDNHQAALSITGDLSVHEREVGAVALDLTARDFKVIDNDMGNVRVDSSMRLAGELRAPRLEGYLSVSTGTLNVDTILASTGESAYATKQTEFQPVAEDTKGQTAPPRFFDALGMDLHLTVPDDLVVKGQNLETPGAPIGLGTINLTLGGDLRVTKQRGTPPTVVGVVNTIRGTYNFQGRRFEILRDGTVRFDGDPLTDLNPELDVRTERVIQAVTANVNIRGTLKQPEIELTSAPPLDQADILSLIVFNQPINELGEGQQLSLAQRAQQLATGAVASQLARSIGSALNLDLFEISTATDSGAAAEVTVGQQLGQNLYVKVQQGIGDQSQTNFVFEYELAKWLRLQTNFLQGATTQQQLFKRVQGTGLDLLFFFSY